MNKTLRLALNRYDSIPVTLRDDPAVDQPCKEITVNLASLYHHYFLDSFDIAPPNPDPAHFEHAHFLLPTAEFRFQGDGLGASPSIRGHRSNELGQAFCRWFLYEHLGATYFAHVERLLRRQMFRPFIGCSLERVAPGDTPDYLCAAAGGTVFLAEAKGRYSAVSFKNKEFAAWRGQFERVTFKDSSGSARRLKGHVVATRFATEEDSDRLKSTLFAEDPSSPGEGEFNPETSGGLALAVRAAHFSNIARKLRQPVLASALANGVPMPEELRVNGVAWRVVTGPLEGRRFVGGYFSVDGVGMVIRRVDGRIAYDSADPLRLDQPGYTCFGIEENILRQVVALARGQALQATPIEAFQPTDFFYSAFSVLRDGTALAPVEFFIPEEQVTL